MSVPSVPRIKRQPRSSQDTLELAWNPPVSDGGSPITLYRINVYSDPVYTQVMYNTTIIGTARYIKIQEPGFIPNGTDLYITIEATNDDNNYGPSARFRAPWQTGNKPGAPRNIAVTYLGGGVYTVTWDAPLSDGGATIFWYVITVQSANPTVPDQRISVSGYERSKTIQGLGPVGYAFIVQAVNCPGYSPALVNTILPIERLQGSSYTSGDTWLANIGNNANLRTGTAIDGGANSVELDGSTSWEFSSFGRLLTTFTVNVWYKNTVPTAPYVDGSPAPAIITQQYESYAPYINFVIGTNMNGNYGGNFACAFFYGSWFIGTQFPLPLGTWINIQYIWDGTRIVTYINGNSIGSVEALSGEAPLSSGLPIRIGQRWDEPQFMTGYIGEVRIYDVPLTAAQVLAAYNESKNNFL